MNILGKYICSLVLEKAFKAISFEPETISEAFNSIKIWGRRIQVDHEASTTAIVQRGKEKETKKERRLRSFATISEDIDGFSNRIEHGRSLEVAHNSKYEV